MIPNASDVSTIRMGAIFPGLWVVRTTLEGLLEDDQILVEPWLQRMGVCACVGTDRKEEGEGKRKTRWLK